MAELKILNRARGLWLLVAIDVGQKSSFRSLNSVLIHSVAAT